MLIEMHPTWPVAWYGISATNAFHNSQKNKMEMPHP